MKWEIVKLPLTVRFEGSYMFLPSSIASQGDSVNFCYNSEDQFCFYLGQGLELPIVKTKSKVYRVLVGSDIVSRFGEGVHTIYKHNKYLLYYSEGVSDFPDDWS